MASAPPNSVGESVDRTSTGSQMPWSTADHLSLLDAVSCNEPSFTQVVCSRSSQQDESSASIIMSDVYVSWARQDTCASTTRFNSGRKKAVFHAVLGSVPPRTSLT